MIAASFSMALNELQKAALSRREREVAALVADGLTNREIGTRLFISERTVDGHLEHIREKLAVSSRAQVAAWFVSQSHAGAAAVTVPQPSKRVSNATRIAIAVAALLVIALAAGSVALRLLTPSGPNITSVVGSTTAGTGLEGGFSGDNGLAIGARLSRPSDVAVAGAFMYIADTGNLRIRRVDQAGTITTLAGDGTASFVEGDNATSTGIGMPVGIAVGPDHLVYFSNGGFIGLIKANNTIQVIRSNSLSPTGLCFAPDGSLYIADYSANKVWLRKPDGTTSVYAGTGAHGFSGDGGSALTAHLSYPQRLSLDMDGNLYIADEGNNRIRRVDHGTGVITTVAGSSDTYGYSGDGGPAAAAKLSLPEGVAVAANGDIYIADTGNNRVRRVDAQTHVITTVAGSGDAGFGGDGGPATLAELYGPAALALTPLGDLYIVDLGNHRVRLIKGMANG
jgi:DNA-binding CsgD family transcriptional regulator/sugar lactone lactonase YvrE